jgi:predicted RNA-binding protein with PUA domain
MKESIIETLGLAEYSYDELEQLVKDIKSYTKERKASAKNTIIEEAKAKVHESDTVVVKYKDGDVEGVVTRVGDKTFTIEFENDEGKLVKVSRQYHFYVKHA